MKTELAQAISKAVLKRMAGLSAHTSQGKVSGPPVKRFIIIDEASVIDRPSVNALLSKARSAGIAVILATQGPADWGDDFEQMTQNTNVAIMMKQGNDANSEMCADYIGKKRFDTVSRRLGENDELLSGGSVSERIDYKVDPDTLRNLESGEAFIRIGASTGTPEFLSYIKVAMRSATSGIQEPKSIPVEPQAPARTPGIARPPQ